MARTARNPLKHLHANAHADPLEWAALEAPRPARREEFEPLVALRRAQEEF